MKFLFLSNGPGGLEEGVGSFVVHRWIVGRMDAIIDSPLGERIVLARTMAVVNRSVWWRE